MFRFVMTVLGFAIFVALIAPSHKATYSSTDGDSHASSSSDVEAYAARAHERSDMSMVDSASYGTTIIDRDSTGQFHLNATVNGQSLPFLVDTGADMVAITMDDARRLGIYVDPYQLEPVGTGAGGALRGKPVVLNSLEVSGRRLNNVPAVVVEGLTTNLLGQSVLREFGKVELAGDRMTIH